MLFLIIVIFFTIIFMYYCNFVVLMHDGFLYLYSL